jgi:YbbR domain-containing protein
VDAEPSLVTLQGKPAVLAAISTIDTDPINIDGAAITATYEVGLRLPRDVTTTDGSKVRVTVRISPRGE